MATSRKDTVWHGLIMGLIGYSTVAITVSLGDVFQGRSFFYTVSLLGEWMFYGLTDPAQVVVWPGAVFAYNGLHLVTFLGFGLLASWLATESERGPLYWYMGLILYLFVFVHLFGVVLLMTEPMRAAVPLAQLWIPTVLSLLAMSVYLVRAHPQLVREMSQWVDPDDSATEAPTRVRPLPRPR